MDILENIMLSEVSQRDKYCMISLICGYTLFKNNTNECIYKTNGCTDIENNPVVTKEGKRKGQN